MANYPPDPGGVFASDMHRRVTAHLPTPDGDAVTVDELLARLHDDAYTGFSYREEDIEPLRRVLDDLQGDGLAIYLDGTAGWRMTDEGLAKLSGPALTELATAEDVRARVAAHLTEVAADEARAADEEPGTVEEPTDAAIDAAITAGEEAGTIAIGDDGLARFEPLPLTGSRLDEAEQQTERIKAEDAAIEKRAVDRAVAEAQEQLQEAEARAARLAKATEVENALEGAE